MPTFNNNYQPPFVPTPQPPTNNNFVPNIPLNPIPFNPVQSPPNQPHEIGQPALEKPYQSNDPPGWNDPPIFNKPLRSQVSRSLC